MLRVPGDESKRTATSTASIPLALDEEIRGDTIKPGDVIAASGFGAGLSWGAAIFQWGQ